MALTRKIDLRAVEPTLTPERFGIFYSMILLGALMHGQREKRTLDDTRREMDLMAKINAVSDVDNDPANKTAIGTPMRVLKDGAEPVFDVDQPTHDMIVRYLEIAIPVCVPEMSYKAIPVLDTVSAASKGEVE